MRNTRKINEIRRYQELNIHDAVTEALESNAFIRRSDPYWLRVLIKPTNSSDRCLIYIDGKEDAPYKGWEPKAEDLMADDWEVVDETISGHLVKRINDVICEAFAEIEDLPDCDSKIEEVFRNIRWKNPDLAAYIMKKMEHFKKKEKK